MELPNVVQSFLYIRTNQDYDNDQKKKYGYTESLEARLYDGHEFFSHLSAYTSLFNVAKTPNYKLKLERVDEIISKISS